MNKLMRIRSSRDGLIHIDVFDAGPQGQGRVRSMKYGPTQRRSKR